jgi:hypothetical protein
VSVRLKKNKVAYIKLKTPNSENFEIKSLKLGEPPNKDIPNEDFEACQIKIAKPPGGSEWRL